ncbi:tetratricopeptide repeat protein [Zavarzinella formosa]|uniref:tetratricopeptide repeat protein n=1 Tax=Zavarzinella formosa TaxID=360055 RepID=UPI0003187B6F|nr:hypothetical protein [Zavarzinella formosa]
MLLRRFLGLCALAFVMAAVSHQTFVHADNVIRKDKKTEKGVTVTGKVSEDTVSGVKVKLSATKDEAIPANEILSVTYSGFPIPVNNKIAEAVDAEAKRDYATMLTIYEGLLSGKEPKDAKFTMPPEAKRNFEYRVASLKASMADGEEEIKAAIKGLNDFMLANADCWQYSHAARQLARLQTDSGDYPAATLVLEKLEKTAAVPAEYKADASAALIDLAFQSEDYAAGKKRVDTMMKDAKATPALKERLAFYQLALDGVQADDAAFPATIKKIEDAIAKSKDPGLKALGYNVLGDCYMAKKRKRDAMWSYLWVDTVYNQDRGEQVKAQTRLIKIFTEDGDLDKVKLFKEKVARSR